MCPVGGSVRVAHVLVGPGQSRSSRQKSAKPRGFGMGDRRANHSTMIPGKPVGDRADSGRLAVETAAGDREPAVWRDWGRRWVLAAKEPLDGSFLDPNLHPLAS